MTGRLVDTCAMKIHLEYAAMLKVHGPASGSDTDIPDGLTIGGLLDHLQVDPVHQKSVTAFVNDQRAHRNDPIPPNARVFLSLPISGG